MSITRKYESWYHCVSDQAILLINQIRKNINCAFIKAISAGIIKHEKSKRVYSEQMIVDESR